MKSIFLPAPITKVIKTQLSEEEIHKKLDILNYQYKVNPTILDCPSGYMSYFDGDKLFRVEGTYKGGRNGDFYVTGFGDINTEENQTIISIKYQIENPYLEMTSTIFIVVISFFWLFAIFVIIDGLKAGELKVLFFPLFLLFFTLMPLLLKFGFVNYIHQLHAKLIKALK